MWSQLKGLGLSFVAFRKPLSKIAPVCWSAISSYLFSSYLLDRCSIWCDCIWVRIRSEAGVLSTQRWHCQPPCTGRRDLHLAWPSWDLRYSCHLLISPFRTPMTVSLASPRLWVQGSSMYGSPKPCIHFFNPKWRQRTKNTQSVLHKLIVTHDGE